MDSITPDAPENAERNCGHFWAKQHRHQFVGSLFDFNGYPGVYLMQCAPNLFAKLLWIATGANHHPLRAGRPLRKGKKHGGVRILGQ